MNDIDQLIDTLDKGAIGQVIALADARNQERCVMMSIDTFEQMQAQMREGGIGFRRERAVKASVSRAQRKEKALLRQGDEQRQVASQKLRRREEHERNRRTKLAKKMPKRNNYLIGSPLARNLAYPQPLQRG